MRSARVADTVSNIAIAAAAVVAVVVAVLMRMDWVEKVAVAEASAVVSAEASG